MLASQLIDKVIAFYKDPDNTPAIDPEEVNCHYYISDNVRCAIGCLLPANVAKQLEELVKDVFLFGDVRSVFYHLKMDASDEEFNITDTSLLTEENLAKLLSVKQAMKGILPDDIHPDYHIPFLRSVQTSHDMLAAKFRNDRSKFNEELENTLRQTLQTYFPSGVLD